MSERLLGALCVMSFSSGFLGACVMDPSPALNLQTLLEPSFLPGSCAGPSGPISPGPTEVVGLAVLHFANVGPGGILR